MTSPPPRVIDAMIAAVNERDAAGFAEAFATDAIIEDWGNLRHGRREVHDWFAVNVVRAKSEVIVVAAVDHGDAVRLWLEWNARPFHDEPVRFWTNGSARVDAGKIWHLEFEAHAVLLRE